MAGELGAHFVKTYYCERFEKVVESCGIPVVIAGGPKMDTLRDAVQMAHDALERGAVGVDMGRNIWQSDAPVPMIRAIRAVVHEGLSVDQACELLPPEHESKRAGRRAGRVAQKPHPGPPRPGTGVLRGSAGGNSPLPGGSGACLERAEGICPRTIPNPEGIP